MICDKCAWKEDCLERKHKGKHEGSCSGFASDSTDLKLRGPRKIRTPEDRKDPIETRD